MEEASKDTSMFEPEPEAPAGHVEQAHAVHTASQHIVFKDENELTVVRTNTNITVKKMDFF